MNMNMNPTSAEKTICYLANGNSIHTKRWIEYLINSGYDVSLLTFHNHDEVSKLNGVTIYDFSLPIPKILNFIYFLILSKILIHKHQFEIFHVHYLTVYGFACALLNPKIFVLTIYGSDILIEPKKNYIYMQITKFVINRSDVITCDAYHLVTEIKKYCDDEEKIHLIYFGIKPDLFYKNSEDQIRDVIKKHKKGITIISTRSLYKVYDIETYIRAASLVIKQISDIIFLVIGDGSEKEKLIDLVHQLQIEDHVTFLGRIPNNELPEYLSISDIYVSTSLSDGGLASSTAEAMACELPSIVTDFGDNNRWVIDDVTGHLFPSSDFETLSIKILNLINNKILRKEMGKNARIQIVKNLNYSKEFKKVENIYEKLHKEIIK
jgi:L-malate glycosyltransferase